MYYTTLFLNLVCDSNTLTITDVTATNDTHGSVELVDNHAMRFDGNDYMELSSTPLNTTDALTVSLDFNPDSLTGGMQALISNGVYEQGSYEMSF